MNKLSDLRTLLRSMNQDEFSQAFGIWKQVSSEKRADLIVDKQFRPGMTVTFEARGRRWAGQIERVGTKNVSVRCEGIKWRVAPQFLTVINPPASATK